MRVWNRFLIIIGILLLVSCGSSGATDPNSNYVEPTPRPPMTLAPTFTPPSTQGPLPTITPPPARETAVPDTPIPFEETVVEMRYQIPSLGLDRRLQGNVANQIIVVDETAGRSIQRNNESSVMFELRQALLNMELASLPDECPGCVFVEYNLSDAGISGSGWLQDPVLLASIENFMSASLGPHFPEGTVIGLRRSASPYAPGQSVAIAEDGRLWTWLATEAEVSPAINSEASPQLLLELAQLSLADLEEIYQADCLSVPIETLSLTQAGDSWTGRIVCPELTLPTTLQPLYVQLDNILAGTTAVSDLPLPESAFPLDGLLHYTRIDDAQLTLFPNGTLIAVDPDGTTYTSTLTTTSPVSLTTSLLDTGLLESGYKTFITTEPVTTTVTPEPPTFKLAVRGPEGVYDGEWLQLPDFAAIKELNTLLTAVFPTTEAATPTPEDELEATPTP